MSRRRFAVDVHDERRRRVEHQPAGRHRVEHLLDDLLARGLHQRRASRRHGPPAVRRHPWLYPGAGNGGWGAPRQVGAGFHRLAAASSGAGDFDGDGYPDVLARLPERRAGAVLRQRVRRLAVAAAGGAGLAGLLRGCSPPATSPGTATPTSWPSGTDGTLWEYAGNGVGGWAGQVADRVPAGTRSRSSPAWVQTSSGAQRCSMRPNRHTDTATTQVSTNSPTMPKPT